MDFYFGRCFCRHSATDGSSGCYRQSVSAIIAAVDAPSRTFLGFMLHLDEYRHKRWDNCCPRAHRRRNAGPSGLTEPMMVASCVGGAFFGDNLSFISDTTVVATRTQGVKMSDKFRTNFAVALPAALLTFALYMYLGWGTTSHIAVGAVDYWKILPYVAVIITAILGSTC